MTESTNRKQRQPKPLHRFNGFFRTWGVLLVVILIFTTALVSVAQSLTKKELEARRKQLQEEIKHTTQILNQINQNQKATYSRYQALHAQIQNRLELINILEVEVDHLIASIDRSTEVVEALNDDIDHLRQEYSGMVRHAYRQKLTKSRPLFILSASSFNNAFQRWQYLRQYDHYRQKQVRLIVETEKTLRDKLYMLGQRKTDKEFLLASARRQSELLSLEMQTKDRILEELKKDETQTRSELKKKQRDAEKLNAAIEAIIKEEIAKSRVAAAPKEDKAKDNAVAARLSDNFSSNKGKLPWPVRKGFLTSRFGIQPHPTIQSVQISNNGIDISTEKGAQVFSVFNGTVVSVQYIPGYEYVVIIKHGQYYTVYAKLDEVYVKKDEEIKTKANIGVVNTDAQTNSTEIHFEVWKDKQRLDPEQWISK